MESEWSYVQLQSPEMRIREERCRFMVGQLMRVRDAFNLRKSDPELECAAIALLNVLEDSGLLNGDLAMTRGDIASCFDRYIYRTGFGHLPSFQDLFGEYLQMQRKKQRIKAGLDYETQSEIPQGTSGQSNGMARAIAQMIKDRGTGKNPFKFPTKDEELAYYRSIQKEFMPENERFAEEFYRRMHGMEA